MASFELLAVVYFLVLAAGALAAGVPWPRRIGVSLIALAAAGAVTVVAQGGSTVLRAWLPHVYLVAGYWLPALLTRSLTHATRFERWLVRSDVRIRPVLPRVPAPLVHLTELAYLLCYPMVPVAFAVVWMAGTAADVNRFWVAVLIAGYTCYVSLPWLLSRPPRLAAEHAATPRHVGAINVFVLGRVSHRLNTFPSGHVAVSFAAAGVLATVSPRAGALVATAAVAVAVGAGAGRYHYVVDVLCGVAAAAVAVGLSM